ncbi:MAG TPA: DNA repair protein RecN [Alphaproteobacteria bacterium]|nr:DNA repair protein RecN [Alphaproteobacteria bacterium]
MLTSLNIQNVALIDKLQLDLSAGLNVLTGETGAGKSILLDALGLALGQRAELQLIRTGCSQALVQAVFELPQEHPVYDILASAELPVDKTEPLILRRQLHQDGRSRCFINDHSVTASLLKQVGLLLVDVVAQFDQRRLHNLQTQLELLDNFAGLSIEVKLMEQLYRDWQKISTAYQEKCQQFEAEKKEQEYRQHILEELDEFKPVLGEEQKLLDERQLLGHQEKLLVLLQDLQHDLLGEKGVIKSLSHANRRMDRTSLPIPQLAVLKTILDQATTSSQEAGSLLQQIIQQHRGDPRRQLEKIEERLLDLRELARKHQVTPDNLPQFHENLQQKLQNFQLANGHLTILAEEEKAARKIFVQAGNMLNQKRRQAAEALSQEVTQHLAKLNLERALFQAQLDLLPEESWNQRGGSKVSFLAAINPGSPFAPLHKIASGGELSRFMLALKLALQHADPVSTMIFDEIDTGVSGATAAAVGQALATLAGSVQLLVVTHLPQVASQGQNHWHVRKLVQNGQTNTSVRLLNPMERREEIARMIAGATISDEARAAAEKLLQKHRVATPSKRLKNSQLPSSRVD